MIRWHRLEFFFYNQQFIRHYSSLPNNRVGPNNLLNKQVVGTIKTALFFLHVGEKKNVQIEYFEKNYKICSTLIWQVRVDKILSPSIQSQENYVT